MGVPLVFVGDDFTGASDSLARYAMAGWRVRLLIAPDTKIGPPLDALGIATDLRAETPAGIAAGIARIWPAIATADPQRLHLKICSTFDSSPGIGSIGVMIAELAKRFRPDITAVIGGQPSLGRYLCFGHLFARGPDGKVHRIDRHPVMAHHPVTPMAESDMRVHLERQGAGPMHLVPVDALDDPQAIAADLRRSPVIFDVMRQQDLSRIAGILDTVGGRQLLIGASSVAEMLTDGSVKAPATSVAPPMHGGTLLFAGSRSSVSRKQVQAFTQGPVLRAGPDDIAAPENLVASCAEQLMRARPVLVSLDPDADYAISPAELTNRTVDILSKVLARAPVGYLGIAGGDTSSRICAGLGLHSLEFAHQIAPGVSICIGRHQNDSFDRMRIMLKGGQMGDSQLFSRFCAWAGIQT